MIWKPVGYQKITGLNAAKAFTVPAGASVAILRPESQNVRLRDDGTNPTAAEGLLIKTGDTWYDYRGDLSAARFIETAGSATLFVLYYSVVG